MKKRYLGKKIIAFTLTAAMMLGMCACGKKKDEESNLSRTVTEMFDTEDTEESTTESREINDDNSKSDVEVEMYDVQAEESYAEYDMEANYVSGAYYVETEDYYYGDEY